MAKTKWAGQLETCLQDIHLKALTPFVGPDLRVDTNNCVVRAIKTYLACTKDVHKGRKHIFIAHKPECTEEIKVAMISSWTAKTVRYAYNNLLDDAVCLFCITVPDSHAFATSWNALQRVSLNSGPSTCGSMAVSHNLHIFLLDGSYGHWGGPASWLSHHSSTGHELASIHNVDQPSYGLWAWLQLGFILDRKLTTWLWIGLWVSLPLRARMTYLVDRYGYPPF